MKPLSAALSSILLPLALGFPAASSAQGNGGNEIYPPALFDAMEYRLIGPYRGGRSTAVAGIPGRPFTFFMGTTGGGVWKTTDAGQTWVNISDGFFSVGSIGAVSVAGSDPNVIYVGTGSTGIRGNVSTGRGVYKSTDAGKTWNFIGLEDAGLIGHIAVHPDNSALVYVAVLGRPFGKNEQRGVFRSVDGGETWNKVLFVSDSTGAVELSMNPQNPREIYAALWRAERKPWTLIDASGDGGVYKTTDGGDSWIKLGGGLPEGLTGRIGISVSPANPNRVWALVSAHDPEGGVYRSDDAGLTWRRVNRDRKLRQRHWYYSHVYADPTDENTVYAMNTRLYKSIDAGQTFEQIRVRHGDVHALWVNPNHSEIMIVGNDGGAQVSLTAGASWSSELKQPTAEFYRVTVDNQFPYRVYGGQQDNSTISVPSWSTRTITPEENWFAVGGCESGHVAVDPRDPAVAYAGCYIGEITRVNRRTGARQNVTVYPVLVDGVAPKDLAYRFQWNAPIMISPHDPDVLYHTSNHVHRTRDGGITWETISPDLTSDNKAQQDFPGGPLQRDHTSVEVYNTIFSFVESPHTPGTLWAGSDDGLVHVTHDNGVTWMNVTPRDMPEGGTVNNIDVSPHQRGRAFIAVYNYRMDDFAPYVFRTDDYGNSWESLTNGRNGIPSDYPVRVVREDPDRAGLLYAGTEFGMFVSFDDGSHWQSLQLNLPITPITDLNVHRQDLVVATQGRSFWILDDLTPLHQLNTQVVNAQSFLYEPKDAYLVRRGAFRGGSAGPQPPPNGAVIRYYFADRPEGDVELEILDRNGDVVRSFSSDSTKPESDSTVGIKKGMNTFAWDLRYEGAELPKGAMVYLGYAGGPAALPGPYQVRLSNGDWSQTQSFELLRDPRRPEVATADLEEQFQLATRIRNTLVETYDVIRTLRSVREQVKAVAERAKEAGYGDDLLEHASPISEKLTAIEDVLVQTKAESRQDPINFPPMLDNQIGYLYRQVAFAYGKPTRVAYERFEDLKNQLVEQQVVLQEVLDTDLTQFNAELAERGVTGVMVPPLSGSEKRSTTQ